MNWHIAKLKTTNELTSWGTVTFHTKDMCTHLESNSKIRIKKQSNGRLGFDKMRQQLDCCAFSNAGRETAKTLHANATNQWWKWGEQKQLWTGSFYDGMSRMSRGEQPVRPRGCYNSSIIWWLPLSICSWRGAAGDKGRPADRRPVKWSRGGFRSRKELKHSCPEVWVCVAAEVPAWPPCPRFQSWGAWSEPGHPPWSWLGCWCRPWWRTFVSRNRTAGRSLERNGGTG